MRRGILMTMVAGMALATMLPGAATAAGPQITDPAGDANGTGQPLDTRPASLDPADVLDVTIETEYLATPVGEDGIDYEPTALLVRFETLAAPRSDTTTFSYVLQSRVGSCPMSLAGYIAGTLTNPGDGRPGDVRWTWSGGCPGVPVSDNPVVGNGAAHENPAWTAQVDQPARELRMRIPFASLTAQQSQVLRPGARIDEPRAFTYHTAGAYIVGTFGFFASATPIDSTATGASFTIGEDVPADVPCTRGCS